MFDLLVESTRPARMRTPKYFLLTVLVYGSVVGAGIIGSILVYKPALADTYETIAMVAPLQPPSAGGGNVGHAAPKPTKQIMSSTMSPTGIDNTPAVALKPPTSEIGTGDGDSNLPIGSGTGSGPGTGIGVIGGINVPGAGTPPVVPPAPKADPPAVKENREDKIVRVSGPVIQGKAIFIPVPEYPAIAKTIHLQGEVKVELVVDKTGHVISATVISGPELLRNAAKLAAQRATFRPTLIGGEPVMIQAVFTFNFKLN